MSKLLVAFCVALVFVSGVTQAQAPDLSRLDVVERSVPDGPVARVDDTFISRDAYLFLYRQQLAALRLMNPGVTIPDGARVLTGIQCLRELLEREVLVREARRLNLTVTDADVMAAYQEEITALKETLREQGETTITEEEILRRGNQTRESALDTIRHELLADRARAHIVREKGVSVSDSAIQEYYNENRDLFRRPGGIHLKQIFVRPVPSAQEATEQAWSQARDKMDRALARIRAGETFEGVARAVSEAPDAQRGGDLGMLAASQLPPFYVEAGQRLQPNGISEVIRSEHGLHVVKLIATEQEAEVSLAEARDRIEAMLLRAKGEEAIAAYTDPLINDVERVSIFLRLEEHLALLERGPEN